MVPMEISPTLVVSVLQIVWIDLLLSGDNAVVIALACRSLPPRQKRIGIVLGASVAVGLRIAFAVVVSTLMEYPFLRLVGGLLLLWIAVKLVTDDHSEHSDVKPASSLWSAVGTIAMADAVMSLDNVVAISAASHGNPWLFIFGLVLSIPLIITGATLLMTILARFPILIWAGAALLGWVAGAMVVSDPWFEAHSPSGSTDAWELPVSLAAAVAVVLVGLLLRRRAVPAAPGA